MIILDTNVVSALMQRDPPGVVIVWLDQQASESVWTTAITIYELEFGIRLLASGQKRRDLEAALRDMISESLGDRVFAFDTEAARQAAEISAAERASGRAVEIRDAQIAGIARARQAQVATRNVRHFVKVCEVTNPWER